MNILKFFSLIGLFLIFLSNGIEAHMHAGLKGGFDKFAKNQGYSDFSEYLDFSKDLAVNAGKILSKYFGNINSIKKKSTRIDLVTNADIECENFIIKSIQNKYPDHIIIELLE